MNHVRIPTSIRAAALLCTIIVTGTLHAADVGLKNGDFSTGKQFWRGDGTVVTLPDGNKVIELTSNPRRQNQVYQEIELGTLVEMEVRFRARFIGSKGQMRAKLMKRNGASTLFAFDLPPDGVWRDIDFKHQRENLKDTRSLVLETLPYDGILQIDDVWAGASGTHTSVRPTVPTSAPPKPAAPVPMPAVVNVPGVPAPKPAVAMVVTPAPAPAPTVPATGQKQVNPDVPLTPLQEGIPLDLAATGNPGSFQPQHTRIAHELIQYVWDWAPTRNITAGIQFRENGTVVHKGTEDVNGDWQIVMDGTVIYRRGDDRSLVWLVRVAGPGRFEGVGAAGGIKGRSVIMTRPVEASLITAKFEGTQWSWGTGGTLKLEPGGIATHTAWNANGSWVAMDEMTIFVKRPANDPAMIVEFADASLQSGKVTSHKPSSTTVTRIKSQ